MRRTRSDAENFQSKRFIRMVTRASGALGDDRWGSGAVCTTALIRIQRDGDGHEGNGRARDGYNKDKNIIPMPHTRERKPVKNTDNTPIMP